MQLNEIHIRDPFVLKYDQKYYLYGTPGEYAWSGADGFYCYESDDLKTWSDPIKCFEAPEGFWANTNFWAPEVHLYKGRFYMFASFFAVGHCRATQILVSDSPKGPFQIHSCPITPSHWHCLDGTFYIEDDVPYMVFCHEWVQIGTGTICAVQLEEDLTGPVGEPFLLFGADEAPWATAVGEEKIAGKPAMVTDGPFLWKEDGCLTLFWSGFSNGAYAEGMAVSESGMLKGPWKQLEKPLFDKDGGHGMLFEDNSGKKLFTMHCPNISPKERPVFYKVEYLGGGSYRYYE